MPVAIANPVRGHLSIIMLMADSPSSPFPCKIDTQTAGGLNGTGQIAAKLVDFGTAVRPSKAQLSELKRTPAEPGLKDRLRGEAAGEAIGVISPAVVATTIGPAAWSSPQ